MRSPNPLWWRQTSTHPGLLGAILGLSVLAIGSAVYLSPTGHNGLDRATAAPTTAPSPTPRSTAPLPFRTPQATASPSAGSKTGVIARNFSPKSGSGGSHGVTAHDVVAKTSTAAPTAQVKKYCSQFRFQQDAQAAYLANLSDPYGLDSGAGPHNGDGIACSMLPVDPARPASTPADAYAPPAPTAAAKAALVMPTQDYFGVSQNGLPSATNQFNALATTIGKAPSSVGYFQYWNQRFDPSKVQSAWSRGALPVMTWMSKSDGSPGSAPDADYSLKNICPGTSGQTLDERVATCHGTFDDYLYQYAGDIRQTNLPIAIRFDHEMNGNWYPWSAGGCAPCHTVGRTTPDDYIAAWRHVWNIFNAVGANQDVIWLWSPGRPDGLSKNPASGVTSIAADYPGAQYVDWVGATVYWRQTTTPTDFATSFDTTISQLKAATQDAPKPIFFGEIGAAESDPSATPDKTKQAWIHNALAGFLADPQIIGFSWFDNAGNDAITGIYNDWRINSSAASQQAFSSEIADSRFSGGIMPDKSS